MMICAILMIILSLTMFIIDLLYRYNLNLNALTVAIFALAVIFYIN